MKKMYTRFSFLFLVSVVSCCLLSATSDAQQKMYYSKFPDPTGHYAVKNANEDDPTCTSPVVSNGSGFADTSAATFTSFTASITAPFTCVNPYHFIANLNLPGDTTLLNAGYKAGVHIRVPSGISLDSLRKYVVVSTYNSDGGTLLESKYHQDISGIDSNQNGQDWYLYFTTTKPFNTVELNVYSGIIPLNTNFEFDVLYVFAATEVVLPATIENFKASVTGKNVNLSFESLNETNVSNYRLERSSNGGTSFTTVSTLPAKGNSNAALLYAYADNVSVDGGYLYRVVTVNKDGTTKATNALSVVISGQGKLLLYPSVVKAGQNIFVKTSETGMVTVLLYDVQGRQVSQQRINSAGQFTITTKGLTTGIYNIKLISNTGNVLTTKIMVN